jgi:hypothetical protein
LPQTVFGSLSGTNHVFQVSSPAIIAPPPTACREDDSEANNGDEAEMDDAKHDGGKAFIRMHETECEENENEMVGEDDVRDDSSGIDFRSTKFTRVFHDDVAHTVTVAGLGTNLGSPVGFTIVAFDSKLVSLGKFSITLSNGYTNIGSLTAGSILLKTEQ